MNAVERVKVYAASAGDEQVPVGSSAVVWDEDDDADVRSEPLLDRYWIVTGSLKGRRARRET